MNLNVEYKKAGGCQLFSFKYISSILTFKQLKRVLLLKITSS